MHAVFLLLGGAREILQGGFMPAHEVPVVGTEEVFQQQQALVGEGVEAGVVFPVNVDL